MQNKQLPLFLILLMMALVACGGSGDADTAQTDLLDLPLVATAATNESADDAAMEDSAETMDDSAEEAHDADSDMAEDAAMEDDAVDAAAEDEGEMADDAMDAAAEDAAAEVAEAEDADADSMEADDADDSVDADDAMDESEDSADEAPDEAAMDEESAEEADDESADSPVTTEDLSGTTVYVVQNGDALSVIAETFGVGSATVMAANNIENADEIYVGQPLIIPGEGDSAEIAADDSEEESEDSAEADEATPTDNEGEYTVQAGDTLSQLAESLEIPSRAIAAKNGFSDQDGLFTGQVLLIPAADEIEALLEAPQPEPLNQPGTYVVQPGDSLAGIAINLEVSLVELASANDIVDYDTIYVGQTLAIP